MNLAAMLISIQDENGTIQFISYETLGINGVFEVYKRFPSSDKMQREFQMHAKISLKNGFGTYAYYMNQKEYA